MCALKSAGSVDFACKCASVVLFSVRMWSLPVETLPVIDISSALVKHHQGQVFITVKLSSSEELCKTEQLEEVDLSHLCSSDWKKEAFV